MDDNFHDNLKLGFELLSYGYHGYWSDIESILVKCAECMSSKKIEGKQLSCDSYCPLYDVMGRERYELTD